MAYFQADFIAFFQELTENNHKTWFDSNKKRYEAVVRKPFEAFVREMIDRLRAVDSAIDISPKDAVFRIYRDVRFARDKTPYKTHMAALISPTGRKDQTQPGLYLQMDARETRIYGGLYKIEKDALYRLRTHISNHPDEFQTLLTASAFKKIFGEMQGEKNKRIPPEFAAAATKQPLLMNKQFYYFARLEPEVILQPNLPDLVMHSYLAGKPVSDFLKRGIAA